jgi:CDP-glucose 4,6-dehydratase
MLGMKQYSDIFRNLRVLVTGHTGFKGSWLTLWLSELGADITGVALPPEDEVNHWELLKLQVDDRRYDIRDIEALQKIFCEKKPELVFHLAAQPLVRRSYSDPLETWSTNLIGTANVLEACRHAESVRAVVVVTTDKCYSNNEWPWGYRESDQLGGHDPYSASKACAELVAASYRHSFFHNSSSPLLATARAGNVIGGGDWSRDRLIPDIFRGIESNNSLEIRSPNSTRPWQHVLESLNGYLMLANKLIERKKSFAEAWNFGPGLDGNRSVLDVLHAIKAQWKGMKWNVTESAQPHEAALLYLDSAKARAMLGWTPIWDFEASIAKTCEWYRTWFEYREIVSRQQLQDYVVAAKHKCVG